jgi:hypothetical protein
VPLGLYLMMSWGRGCAPNGDWFGKPSYLGFWVSHNPWGPWTQVHEETAWTPQGDSAARAFAPQIAPKWIAEDGQSFWLVWADFQFKGSPADADRLKEEEKRITNNEEAVGYFQNLARTMPYYSFNTQRVDLVLA